MRLPPLAVRLPLPILLLAACAAPSLDSGADVTTVAAYTPGGPAFLEVDGAFSATNRAWRFNAQLGAEGARFSGPAGEVGLSFAGWGRGAVTSALPAEAVQVCGADDGQEGEACRVEYRRGAATEWWVNAAAGVEQGWDLGERPEGNGNIVLGLNVEGAAPVLREGAVELVTASGMWTLGGLSAADASGRQLPASFEVDEGEGQVRIVVDDTDAVWPIRIDPVMTTAVTTWTGTSGSTDALGTAVTTGDFNLDGKADIAIGVPGYNSAAGAVFVYYGTSTAPSTTASVTLTVPAGAGKFGYSLDTGDFNGDGYADLAVGAPYSTTTATNDGAVWLYNGSAAGLSSTMSTKLTGSAIASAYFGNAVAKSNVNGDAYDDVVIGEYGYSSETGRAWIYAGSATGITTATFRTLSPPSGTQNTGGRYGWSVSGGKSTTSDVYQEIAVGAPQYSTSTSSSTLTGRTSVYTGATTFFTVAPTTTTYTGTAGYRYGYAVTIEGSYNGDAYADLVVGAPTGTATGVGRIYLYNSTGAALPGGATRTIDGPSVGSYFGATLTAIADTDDDLYAELLVGAPYATTDAGYAALYDGASTGPTTSTRANTFTGSSGDTLGLALGGGDVNGDNNADILIASPGYSTSDGRVVLELGGADSDNDGYVSNGSGYLEDCADSNSAINPAASEVCDASNTDEDCDGLADDLDSSAAAAGKSTWYVDVDGDGYGDLATSTMACDQPSGYVANSTDCNDNNAAINPAATEVCDASDVDEDCDGSADNNDTSTAAAGKTTYYVDSDGDSYGSTTSSTYCDQPTGYASNSTDCDDGTAAVNPGATEICDAANTDEDCDGVSDNNDASAATAGKTTYYVDSDGDSYGGATSAAYCDLPSGYATSSTDCDDGVAAINPGATEVCDAGNTDEDCDGLADNSDTSAAAAGKSTYYVDADGDSYGGSSSAAYCDMPSGSVATSSDCDDGNAAVNPGATEVCDALNTDEDCNRVADDNDVSATGKSTYYVDADADGYGGATSDSYCDVPAGSVATSTDCDDGNNAINPGETEVCDATNTDEDCDGVADNNDTSTAAPGKSTYYVDADGDSYGGAESGAYCDLPSGYVPSSTDCNDGDAAINPGATEVCDAANTDEDCSGAADDNDIGAAGAGKTTYYADADGDSYGGGTSGPYCDQPTGYVASSTDCDDGDAAINPGATEVCDAGNTDEDCDGQADDLDSSVASSGKNTYYVDSDADGYGSSTPGLYCDVPAGSVASSTDCDDTNAAIHPGASEVCDAANTDEDCDGTADDLDSSVAAAGKSTYYVDADSDGYGGATSGTYCDQPADYVGTSTDCDDSTSAVHPGAAEVCDAANTDEDCDGRADDQDSSVASSGKTTYYRDADTDGYGGAASATYCDQPSGYVATFSDCDDANGTVNPGATEVCDAANVDEDCDGLADDLDSSVASSGKSTYYVDVDTDSYGGASSGAYCDQPSGSVATSTDCDDNNPVINPGAAEICDATNTDEDCDGLADDNDSSAASAGKTSYYTDADADSYGGATSGTYCDLPTGYVATSTDCDDSDAAIYPGATEVCDGADNDCDGTIDDGVTSTFYADGDADGFGDPAASASTCTASAGYVADASDCDDADAAINPDAAELCDAANVDENCNDLADDADPSPVGEVTFYTDADGDTYGSGTSSEACDPPAHASTVGSDCDDALASVHPGALDVAGDAVDADCDGNETCYVDADNDGYRPDSGATVPSLDADCSDLGEALASAPGSDCDDLDSTISPAATDLAGDGVDADCDGTESCYVDTDGDGARTAFLIVSADADCLDLGEALASADLDCDDTDAASYPAATDVTGSGIDEDCDGVELCYADVDDDGYRPDGSSTVVSSDSDCADAGEALASDLTGDCDDTSASYHPDAAEADCTDPSDYNCDGSSGYADGDADGWAACAECDDGDATVYPGGVESNGDGVDGDCDGVEVCYVDADGDAWRTDTTISGGSLACNAAGEASLSVADGDCDDADSSVNPDAIEAVGDEVDSDCDDAEVCYVDADGDDWRTSATMDSVDVTCTDAGEATADEDLDCDDTNAAINPLGTEVAGDGVDADCDGGDLCFADADGDGYRSSATVPSSGLSCTGPGEATALAALDCDDADAAAYPGALELVGDAVDSDCDGSEVCYADVDDDGYRPDDESTVVSTDIDCADPGEALAADLGGDCDDADLAYNPGASESDCADPNDYNCDGSTGFDDVDADGWAACTECNDTDASVNPDAVELPGDLTDSNCDSVEDCYVDADDDAWRPDDSTLVSSNVACDAAGEATVADLGVDCDDTDASVNPDAAEITGDELDQDCDGAEVCFVDADGDGYRPDSLAEVESADLVCTDSGEAPATAATGDCDDGTGLRYPGAPETDCTDPLDYNCDGSSGYTDADADGYAACEECDDGNAAVNPAGVEVCNGRDDDCDGVIDGPTATDGTLWYADADADGYTDPALFVTDCTAPAGYAAGSIDADCDDTDASVSPGVADIPDDGIDQDCDFADATNGDTGGDTGDTGDDTGADSGDTDNPPDTSGGTEDTGEAKADDCGCASTPGPASGAVWLAAFVALAGSRRRR